MFVVLDVLGFCLAALLLFGGCLWFVLLDELGLKGGLVPRFWCWKGRAWCVVGQRSWFGLGWAGDGLFGLVLGRFCGLLLLEVYGRIVELKACCWRDVKIRVVPWRGWKVWLKRDGRAEFACWLLFHWFWEGRVSPRDLSMFNKWLSSSAKGGSSSSFNSARRMSASNCW